MATVLNLPSTTYQAGTFTSQNFNFPSGIESVTAAFTVDSADLSDSGKSLTYKLERFDAGSAQWILDNGFTWQGGMINPKTGLPAQPVIWVDVGPLAGARCRITLTLPARLTTAIVVSTVP